MQDELHHKFPPYCSQNDTETPPECHSPCQLNRRRRLEHNIINPGPFWNFLGSEILVTLLTHYLQYVTLRKRKNDWESVTTSHPDYIRFYNSLWLVANDVIIGIALGSYIIDNSAWVAETISEILRVYSVQALQRSMDWLMGWPAGLKLNGELADFLGDLFLWVIDHWSSEYSHSSWGKAS